MRLKKRLSAFISLYCNVPGPHVCQEVLLGVKGRKKSPCWSHGRIRDRDERIAKERLCLELNDLFVRLRVVLRACERH